MDNRAPQPTTTTLQSDNTTIIAIPSKPNSIEKSAIQAVNYSFVFSIPDKDKPNKDRKINTVYTYKTHGKYRLLITNFKGKDPSLSCSLHIFWDNQYKGSWDLPNNSAFTSAIDIFPHQNILWVSNLNAGYKYLKYQNLFQITPDGTISSIPLRYTSQMDEIFAVSIDPYSDKSHPNTLWLHYRYKHSTLGLMPCEITDSKIEPHGKEAVIQSVIPVIENTTFTEKSFFRYGDKVVFCRSSSQGIQICRGQLDLKNHTVKSIDEKPIDAFDLPMNQITLIPSLTQRYFAAITRNQNGYGPPPYSLHARFFYRNKDDVWQQVAVTVPTPKPGEYTNFSVAPITWFERDQFALEGLTEQNHHPTYLYEMRENSAHLIKTISYHSDLKLQKQGLLTKHTTYIANQQQRLHATVYPLPLIDNITEQQEKTLLEEKLMDAFQHSFPIRPLISLIAAYGKPSYPNPDTAFPLSDRVTETNEDTPETSLYPQANSTTTNVIVYQLNSTGNVSSQTLKPVTSAFTFFIPDFNEKNQNYNLEHIINYRTQGEFRLLTTGPGNHSHSTAAPHMHIFLGKQHITSLTHGNINPIPYQQALWINNQSIKNTPYDTLAFSHIHPFATENTNAPIPLEYAEKVTNVCANEYLIHHNSDGLAIKINLHPEEPSTDINPPNLIWLDFCYSHPHHSYLYGLMQCVIADEKAIITSIIPVVTTKYKQENALFHYSDKDNNSYVVFCNNSKAAYEKQIFIAKLKWEGNYKATPLDEKRIEIFKQGISDIELYPSPNRRYFAALVSAHNLPTSESCYIFYRDEANSWHKTAISLPSNNSFPKGTLVSSTPTITWFKQRDQFALEWKTQHNSLHTLFLYEMRDNLAHPTGTVTAPADQEFKLLDTGILTCHSLNVSHKKTTIQTNAYDLTHFGNNDDTYSALQKKLFQFFKQNKPDALDLNLGSVTHEIAGYLTPIPK